MGEEQISKINIYILNLFCTFSRLQLNREFSSKNEIEKKNYISGKTVIFAIYD